MAKQQRLLWGIGGLILGLWFLLPTLRSLGEGLLTLVLLGIAGTVVGLNVLPHWRRPLTVDTQSVSPARLDKALNRTETLITTLVELVGQEAQMWQPRLAEVRQQRERQVLRFVVLGNPAVGKSAIATHLTERLLPQAQTAFTVTEQDQLVTLPIPPADALPLGFPTVADLPDTLATADLVLFVIHSDLTASEYQCLQTLQRYQKSLLLVFNKQDQYLPAQRLALQQALQQRLEGVSWVAIAAQPQAIKIRQHQPDGTVQETLETPAPDIAPLLTHLQQVMNTEAKQLILQQTYQQTLSLQAQVQSQLNRARQQQSLPVIERYQWLTGATAFANPVPTLDLLAAAAISSKMVIDLGKIYHLQFSVAQAQAVATTLSTAMLKLGCVELATQAITVLLKGHVMTYVAGGLVQGVSAAHLTRVAGLSLLEHFQYLSAAELVQPESNWQPERLQQVVAKVFATQQQLEGLKRMMQQAMTRFEPQAASSL